LLKLRSASVNSAQAILSNYLYFTDFIDFVKLFAFPHAERGATKTKQKQLSKQQLLFKIKKGLENSALLVLFFIVSF